MPHARIIGRLQQSISSTTADMDKKISCPVLVLWGANGIVGRKYDVLAVWRERATQVSGKALPSGHWLAEEVPKETLAEVQRFLAT